MTYSPCPNCGGAILGEPGDPCPNLACLNSERGRESGGRKIDLGVARPSGLVVPTATETRLVKPNREERRGKARRKRSRK